MAKRCGRWRLPPGDGLAPLEQGADLGDVLQAAPPSGLVEAELDGHLGCRQQRELFGGLR
jgi:hypothetical protein